MQLPIATPKRTCRGRLRTLADARERSAHTWRKRVKHDPAPRPPLRNKNPSLRIRGGKKSLNIRKICWALMLLGSSYQPKSCHFRCRVLNAPPVVRSWTLNDHQLERLPESKTARHPVLLKARGHKLPLAARSAPQHQIFEVLVEV